MKRIKFSQDVWEREFLDKELKVDIFVFTLEIIDTQATVQSRKFGPTVNISEDSDIGVAISSFETYLDHYNLVAP